MAPPRGGCTARTSNRPRHEVAEIFRAHGDAYRATHSLTIEQWKAMRAIETCRTAVLGGHVDVCPDCGHEVPSYNSCRDRHCPKCQALAQAKWLAAREAKILPVHYFHVVFTLPAELRALVLWNRREMYTVLFRAASQTLLDLGRDPKRLGAQLGVTAVLHTWTRDLRFHPHLHCIVTGGGLTADGDQWVDAKRNYLFPVEVLGRLFRGKFMDALTKAYNERRLALPGELSTPSAFENLRRTVYDKKWVVYAKRPFAGPRQLFSYLGRYTHRVAISNHRILDVTTDNVTIRTWPGQAATMHPHEFIRRFLLHVLPRGFVKIRHYGLMASSNVRTRLETARRLLAAREPDVPLSTDVRDGWRHEVEQIADCDPRLCPVCGGHARVRFHLPPQFVTGARAPPRPVRLP